MERGHSSLLRCGARSDRAPAGSHSCQPSLRRCRSSLQSASIEEVCAANIATQEFIGRACCLSLSRSSCGALGRYCIAALPGGRSKPKRNRNILAKRLDRWALGERRALWDEAMAATSLPQPALPDDAQEVERHQRAAIALARKGLPGKAVQRLAGARHAPPTPAVETAMRAKFPPRPPHQHTSTGALGRCSGELRRRGILTPLKGHRPSPKLQQKAIGQTPQ